MAGGWLVLAGPGMYVNQAMAAGLGDEVGPADLDLVIERSGVVGVAPAIEITPSTLPESIHRVRERGFTQDSTANITCLTRAVPAVTDRGPSIVEILPVESATDLAVWQETSATGWGHVLPEARRASDAFAAAAQALDNEHMVVAFDPADGRPVGCASMTVRDGVAMLGGMSTLPAERRRGVQATLLRYRLGLARRLGCDLAMTTATTGSASERNLRRHGFEPIAAIETLVLPPARSARDARE